MTRSIACLCLATALILLTACAESLHQGQQVAPRHAYWNAGDLEAPSYWSGPGYWWSPFGYYGYGSSGYRGGYGGGSQAPNAAAARPTPPANALSQFQKKY